jgi:hypothetical protein
MPGYLGKAMTHFGHKKQTKSRTHHIPTKSPNKAQKLNMQTKKMNPPPQQRRDKICPGGGRDITIL